MLRSPPLSWNAGAATMSTLFGSGASAVIGSAMLGSLLLS